MAGKIKKLLENELVGGTQTTDVYPVTSTKAVYDENNERLDNIINKIEPGIIYDVSANNDGAVFESLQALLSSSSLNTLIPTSVRCGGMSIRFIQGSVPNSDNKYVQFRCIANDFTTDTAQWQGVKGETIIGSTDIIESGGVNKALSELTFSPSVEVSPITTAGGWKLTGNKGNCTNDENYSIVKYNVLAGEILKIQFSEDSDVVFQFQNSSNVPSSSEPNKYLVGTSYKTGGIGVVKVPEGATYLIVSRLNTTTTNYVKKIVGVDNIPIKDSHNLIESGVVYNLQQRIDILQRLSVGKNLIGPENMKKYPVLIKAGQEVCVYRKDGANMSSMNGMNVYLYEKDGTQHYWGLSVNSDHRVISYNKDFYYVSTNANTPMMLEYGDTMTGYEEYIAPSILTSKEFSKLQKDYEYDIITSAKWIRGNIASSTETMGMVSNNNLRICAPTIFHVMNGSTIRVKVENTAHIRILKMDKFGNYVKDLGWHEEYTFIEETYCMLMLAAYNYEDVVYPDFASNIEMKLFTPKPKKTEIKFKSLYDIGDCILLKFGNGETMLIDTGSQFDYTDKGNIKGWLLENGVTKFDYIMISHYHGDHMGNIESICQDFDVSHCTFLIPPPPPSTYTVDDFYAKYQRVMAAIGNRPYIDEWNKLNTVNRYPYYIGDVPMYMYNTDHTRYYEVATDNPNNMSICAMFEIGNTRILFSGDATYTGSGLETSETAYAVLAREIDKTINILKTPHHGIDGANSMNFNFPTKICSDLFISSSPQYREAWEKNYKESCWIAYSSANNIKHIMTGISGNINLVVTANNFICDGWNYQNQLSASMFNRFHYLKGSVVLSKEITATTTAQGNINTDILVDRFVVIAGNIRRTDNNRICFCEIGNYTGSAWGMKLRDEYMTSEVVANTEVSGTIYYIPLHIEYGIYDGML